MHLSLSPTSSIKLIPPRYTLLHTLTQVYDCLAEAVLCLPGDTGAPLLAALQAIVHQLQAGGVPHGLPDPSEWQNVPYLQSVEQLECYDTALEHEQIYENSLHGNLDSVDSDPNLALQVTAASG